MDISTKMRQLRTEKGIKQIEIADLLNISQSSYTNYENGKRRPNYEMIIKLADFYNVSLDEMFGRISGNESKKNDVKIHHQSKAHRELIEKIKVLNNEDMNKVIGYVDMLILQNSDYNKALNTKEA